MQLSRLLTRLTPLLVTLVVLMACGGPPPTEYVIITSTPTIAPIVLVVTATQDGTTTPAASASPTTAATMTLQPTITATNTVRQGEATDTADLIPTATFSQIQVAEQRFENGRMFWLEPIDQIWVIVETDQRNGVWTVYDDEFEEGDIEFDPKLVPPSEELLQPERGFGKLWRDNPEIQAALGWALEPEIGYVSNYEYQPAGEVVDNEYVAGSGYHVMTNVAGRRFRFNEINGTWQQLRANQ